MRKDDVTTYYISGRRVPAVNVKVYGPDPRTITSDADLPADPAFFAWVAEQSDDDIQTWWDAACESGWEQMQSDAEEVFGPRVKVWAEGRSGGWAIVEGLPDLDDWDAIQLGKWSRFAKWARAVADDIPASTLRLMLWNVYEPEQEHREGLEQRTTVPDWRVATDAARELCTISD